MKYIMTGTEGLIGGFLQKRLQDEGHTSVLDVDMRKGSNILNLDGVKLNPQTQKVDMLFHLASHCKINEGTENPELPHINNCDGTFQVLEFARRNGIQKIMNFSSSRVLSPEENPYTASKKYGENLVRAHHDCFGLEYITVRPSTVYGPVHDITSRLITTWVQNALEGKDLEIFGDKRKTLDFTYIDDFVDGIVRLYTNWDITKNQEYNISGENEISLPFLAHIIKHEAKSDSKVVYKNPEIAQPQQVSVDISKMKALGFKPRVGIREGVRTMVEFYRRRQE